MPQKEIADVPGALLRRTIDPLKCPKCSLSSVLTLLTANLTSSGTHHTAHCIGCGGYIQHLKVAAFRPLTLAELSAFVHGGSVQPTLAVEASATSPYPPESVRTAPRLPIGDLPGNPEGAGFTIGGMLQRSALENNRRIIVQSVAAAWLQHCDYDPERNPEGLAKWIEYAVTLGKMVADEMERRGL